MLQNDMRLFHKGCYHDMRECSNNMHEINTKLHSAIGSCRVKTVEKSSMCYEENSNTFSVGRLKFVRKYLAKRDMMPSSRSRSSSNQGLKRRQSPEIEADKEQSYEEMLQQYQKERKRVRMNANESCSETISVVKKPLKAATSKNILKLTLIRRKCNDWIVKNNAAQSEKRKREETDTTELSPKKKVNLIKQRNTKRCSITRKVSKCIDKKFLLVQAPSLRQSSHGITVSLSGSDEISPTIQMPISAFQQQIKLTGYKIPKKLRALD